MSARSYSAVLVKENSIVGIAQSCLSNLEALERVLADANQRKKRLEDYGYVLSGPIADVLVCDTAIPFCDQIKNITDADDKYYEDFIASPEKEVFSRMAVADLSMRALTNKIKEIGPEGMYEEAKKSDFTAFVIQVIGVFAMLGVKMGYAKERDENVGD